MLLHLLLLRRQFTTNVLLSIDNHSAALLLEVQIIAWVVSIAHASSVLAVGGRLVSRVLRRARTGLIIA